MDILNLLMQFCYVQTGIIMGPNLFQVISNLVPVPLGIIIQQRAYTDPPESCMAV